MELKEKQIGSCTVYEGMTGRWCRASFSRHATTVYQRMLDGEATTQDYIDAIAQEIRDRRQAHQLLGRPARGLIGRFRLRVHFRDELRRRRRPTPVPKTA